MAGKGSNKVEETASQRALASLAQAKAEDYRTRWLPVQRQLIAQVQGMGAGDSAQRKQAGGMAAADTEQAFGLAGAKMEKALSNSGALPGSAKGNLAITGMGEDKAKAKGLGVTNADQMVDNAYTQGLSAIMAMGKGQSSQAVAGLEQQAAMSGAQARQDAELSLQNRMDNAQLAGQAVGYGVQRFANPSAPAGGLTGATPTAGATDYGLAPAGGVRLGLNGGYQ